MYCSNCGKEIKDESRFCPNCGKQLVTVGRSLPPVQKPVLPPPISKMNMQEQQNNGYQSNTASGVRQYDGVYAKQTYDQQTYTDSYQTTGNYNEGQNQYYQNEQFYGQQSYEQPLPMNWYKFVIWCQLFLSAFYCVTMGILCFTGFYHGSIRSILYSNYPGVIVLDIIFGGIYIGMAALAIFVRQQLANYKKNSPLMLLGYYFLTALLYLAMEVLYKVASGGKLFRINTVSYAIGHTIGFTIGYMLIPGIVIALNYVYFEKRKAYFNQ